MANRTLHSSNITFLDYTDNRKIDVYIASNLPTTQIYNVNTSGYSPDWASTNLVLRADVFLDAQEITDNTTITWYTKDINGTETLISATSNRVISGDTLTIKSNELSSNNTVTYVCKATYQSIVGRDEISFAKTSTGLNGADGTSISIKGTADTITSVSGTSSYTITYSGSLVTTAQLGDAYLYNGDLYVCTDARNGNDYFINVGHIQGPAGQDAKGIILNTNGQVFKVNKTGLLTPSTISITAYPVNTSVTLWSYSTNGGQTFVSTPPNGVARNGNTVTITGSSITNNVIVIKASDGVYSDTVTVYKVVDGSDGVQGSAGVSAPVVFLTNENITFNSDSRGRIATTTRTSNVVSYIGATAVTPTVGTITGLPSGMTVTQSTVNNEVILTITITNNTTLGSTASNSGYITIPVTIPTTPAVSTNLVLNWSKINSGRSISSIAARYAVSNSNTTAPTNWQTTMPTRLSGEYLWIADYITYDNGTNATVGARVVTGDSGNNGVSINSVISYFANNQSQTTAPESGWTTTPTREVGYYTWRKDLIAYSDSTTAYTTPVCITGDKGENGQTYYVHIRYSANSNGSGMTSTPQSNTLYMGTCSTTTSVAPATNTSYTWVLIRGSNGINGTNGNDGTSYYVHIRYRETEGDTTLLTTPSDYMGVYSGTSITAPTSVSSYIWYNVKGSSGERGEDSVVFQVYSSNGYVLSKDLQSVTLQTFAHKGSALISAGASYQWYESSNGEWQEISGAVNAYYEVLHTNVTNNKSYKCTMTFEGLTYSDVITIEDKTDINVVFTSKPTSYSAGDIWIIGVDYIPTGYESGTMLRAEHTNNTYSDADWVLATKYDKRVEDLEEDIYKYNQYFSFDNTSGITITAVNESGTKSPFSTTLSNNKLSFNQGSQEVAYINNNKLNITEAEVISPLTVTGKYSGNTMLQAPTINLGDFSLIVESNGSLSIVSNS